MLFRFSLYGFLKNQRYFEPFLYLALLEKGLDFFLIGLLIGFRELVVNAMEIPSGAIADVLGRRRCMIGSFLAYIASFLIFGFAAETWLLFIAMFFYGVGDAFRTGTHKAMIFTWLRLQGREAERTKVYGYTRSWSKIGSAVSAAIAALFVFVADSYTWVFFLSAAPYVVNVINFLGYPRQLDLEVDAAEPPTTVLRHLAAALKEAVARRNLRRLILESMGFEGVFHAVKDYLQPVLQAAAIAWLAGWVADGGWSETQRSAVLVGIVYIGLYALAAAASRHAHRVSERSGGDDAAARRLWIVNLGVFVVLAVAGFLDVLTLLIVAFVALHVLQNTWRPILVSRFDEHGSARRGATILSLESQSRRVATMVFAPLVGFAVDYIDKHQYGGEFWPIGLLGLLIALPFIATARRTEAGRPTPPNRAEN